MNCHFTWFAIMPQSQYNLFVQDLKKILKNTINSDPELDNKQVIKKNSQISQ